MTFARQINQITKNNTIMTRKTIMTRGGQTYEAPSVEILDVMSEGVFCISNGDDGSYIDPAYLDDWGTL